MYRIYTLYVLLTAFILSSCKPILNVSLHEHPYDGYDYDLFLQGDWQADSLSTAFSMISKKGKSILTNFKVSPSILNVYLMENGEFRQLSFNDTLIIVKNKPATIKVEYIPRFEEIFTGIVSFVSNKNNVKIIVTPTNFYINQLDLDKSQVFVINKNKCKTSCFLTFTRGFDSVYIYDNLGNIVIRKIFDENTNSVDIRELVAGKYLVQLNGQVVPQYLTILIE